jgi:cytosine deaminase
MSAPPCDLILRWALLESGAPAELGMSAGRILTRRAVLRVQGRQEIDAGGRLTIPGFVDPHLHLDKALSWGEIGEPVETLSQAIAVSRRLKASWTEEAIEERASRAVAMAVRAGTTALRTHVDVDGVIGLRGFRALRRVRERYQGTVRIQIVAFPQEGLDAEGHVEDMLRRALEEGADAVGGIPARAPDPRRHIDRLFRLATQHDADIDMHVDESDDPADLSLEYLAERTLAEGYEGRVVAGHCTSLAAVPLPVLHRVAAKVAAAGITIVTLPSTNLHLQGRCDPPPVRRGLAPVRALLAEGVNVAYGSDNIRDPFTPFGNARMLEVGLLLAHAAHLGTGRGLRTVLEMATGRAARALGLDGYGLDEGCLADLVVLEAATPEEAIVSAAPPRWVIARGHPVVGAARELASPSLP